MPTQQSIEISIGIRQRFFAAVDALIVAKHIRGRQTYCRLYDIDKRNFYRQEKDLNSSHFKTYWLVPLVQVYGVSAHWLLTGEGRMFAKPAASSQQAAIEGEQQT